MPIKAKLFYLQRDRDISGVSGIGNVADGVEFANGMCALSFHSEFPHCNVYVSMRALLEVHGHEGATKVVFVVPNPMELVASATHLYASPHELLGLWEPPVSSDRSKGDQ